MARPVTDITIVGGGTAGWLTAAYLNHRLQWGYPHRGGVRITVIEAPDIPTIGVGEATVPTMRQTLKQLEISENEFVARTGATFKLGIRFDGWDIDESGDPRSFFHSFGCGFHVRGRNPAAPFLDFGARPPGAADELSFSSVISHAPEMARLRKGPRRIDAGQYHVDQQYAYHLNATAFADFLKEICIARGVEHVSDRVLEAQCGERDQISALQLEKGGLRPVQLVIDCTGFQGLLINKALEEPFVSFSDYLFNDRALPIQFAHNDKADLYPATVSTSRNYGWSWQIPLQSRIGTGYVFSSAFASDDQILAEVEHYQAGKKAVTEPRFLPIRVGHCRRSWVGNCVAIGLSSGFIEPLESTAIQCIELACRRLLQYFPSLDFEPQLADKFNGSMNAQYEEIRDFLSIHFCLSNRDDTPYWRAVRHEAKRSDAFDECLALWRYLLPDQFDPRCADVFSFWSVCTLLLGKGFYKQAPPGGTDTVPSELWDQFLMQWNSLKPAFVTAMPDHGDLLQSMVSAHEPGESASRSPASFRQALGSDALSMSMTITEPIRWRSTATTR